MEREELEPVFTNYIKLANIKLEKKQFDKFFNYMNILLEWNERMNLTAIIDKKEILLKHFIDSLLIENYIGENTKIIDVGTGAGFPGIPLKILKPQLKVLLLDSLNKRIEFLKEVIKKLELNEIEAIHGRAEELGKEDLYREEYDIAVSRAVADLRVLVEYMLPFVKVGGTAICMKGPNIEKEIESSQRIIYELGGEIKEVKQIILPDTDIRRNNIIIKKVRATNIQFPRRADKIKKQPIF